MKKKEKEIGKKDEGGWMRKKAEKKGDETVRNKVPCQAWVYSVSRDSARSFLAPNPL